MIFSNTFLDEDIPPQKEMGMDIPAIAMFVYQRCFHDQTVSQASDAPPRTGQVKLADLGFQGSSTEKQQEGPSGGSPGEERNYKSQSQWLIGESLDPWGLHKNICL